jgi:hypothetical protein
MRRASKKACSTPLESARAQPHPVGRRGRDSHKTESWAEPGGIGEVMDGAPSAPALFCLRADLDPDLDPHTHTHTSFGVARPAGARAIADVNCACAVRVGIGFGRG